MHPQAARRPLVVALALLLVVPLVATAGPPATAEAGQAMEPALDAGTLSFGEVAVGTASAPLQYVYTNDQPGPATVAPGISGPQAPDFAVAAETCSGAPIPPAGTCTVDVTFTPAAEYERVATLTLADGRPDPPIVALAGVGVLPPSGVTWADPRVVYGPNVRSDGTGLAGTVSRSTGFSYLHAVVQRYGPLPSSIYYRRATRSGSSDPTGTWSSPTRLSPTTQHARRPSIAAAGSYVYVTWSSFSWSSPATAPRVVYFRSNRMHGAVAWGPIRRLTGSSDRIDYPRIAASGARVLVVYTNAATGDIRVKVSNDRGATWLTRTLGTTTRVDAEGRSGTPMVAMSGSTAVVAWISSAAGTVKARVTTDGGVHWRTADTLGTGARAGTWPSVAVLGSRVAVAWTGATSMVVRVRSGTTWRSAIAVRPSVGGRDYEAAGIGQVALAADQGIALAWQACWADCTPGGFPMYDLLWRESWTNGASWARSQVLGDAESGYPYFARPSVVWTALWMRRVMTSRTSGAGWSDVASWDGPGVPAPTPWPTAAP